MIAQPIDVVLLVWFALAALSTAYVAYDSSRTTLDEEQTTFDPHQHGARSASGSISAIDVRA